VEQSNKKKTRGTGLGLAISKALVDMHGGEIWVDSGVDRGSVFSFTLPAKRPLET
jgi:two-component system sensor histidine kinase ChiS